MSYRTMLVALDDGPAGDARVDIAIDLAKAFDAHLIGLACASPVELQGTLDSATALAERARQEGVLLLAQARALALGFRRRCEAAGLASFEALADQAPGGQSLTAHAQCADLLILSQPDPALPDYRAQLRVLEEALVQCARPALLIPFGHRQPLRWQRAVVGWDGSRESIRAMTDALPMLQRADTVALMHWRRETEGAGAARQLGSIQRWLAFHGVDAEPRDIVSAEPVGAALLSAALDDNADFIVMGAYGHPRWSERLFGGVSRTLIGTMSVPVLMSH